MSHIPHENIKEIALIVARQVIESVRLESSRPKWLTIEEAAEYAKASKNKIQAWIDEGYIYGFKRTGKWIVDRESIDNWYSSEKIGV